MLTTVEHPRLGEVVLSQSRRARRISISVRGTGCVRLSFPYGVSARRAMEFLERKAGWVEAARARLAQRRAALPPQLPPAEEKARIEELRRAAKADLCVVAAYGCILPDELLEMFPLGCVNVHASLLPRWRGAAPIQRAVLEGDELAGASIMRVVHELDAGAYCAQVSTAVAGKTSSELLEELGHLGAEALVEAIGRIADGTAVWTEQDESLVTYAHKIEKAEMRLDPADGALANVRRVLASTDAAPARCEVAGKGVRLMRARTCDDALAAGEVLVSHGRVALGCADGALEVLDVKPDGKREMQASAWAAGLRADHLAWGRI